MVTRIYETDKIAHGLSLLWNLKSSGCIKVQAAEQKATVEQALMDSCDYGAHQTTERRRAMSVVWGLWDSLGCAQKDQVATLCLSFRLWDLACRAGLTPASPSALATTPEGHGGSVVLEPSRRPSQGPWIHSRNSCDFALANGRSVVARGTSVHPLISPAASWGQNAFGVRRPRRYYRPRELLPSHASTLPLWPCWNFTRDIFWGSNRVLKKRIL